MKVQSSASVGRDLLAHWRGDDQRRSSSRGDRRGIAGKEHAAFIPMAGSGRLTFTGVYDRQPRFRTCGRRGFEVRSVRSPARRPRQRRVELVTPRPRISRLAKAMLLQGKQFLGWTNPMTDHAEQAGGDRSTGLGRRIASARAHERFNPFFISANGPRYGTALVETHRWSPFPARTRTSGWCWMLMIHGSGLVLAL